MPTISMYGFNQNCNIECLINSNNQFVIDKNTLKTIPENIKNQLYLIYIPYGVSEIREFSFVDMPNLVQINVPASVLKIHDKACVRLPLFKNFNIENSAKTTVCKYAAFHCGYINCKQTQNISLSRPFMPVYGFIVFRARRPRSNSKN